MLVRTDVLYSFCERLARHSIVLIYAIIARAILIRVDKWTMLLVHYPHPFVAVTHNIPEDASSVHFILLVLPFVPIPSTPAVQSMSVFKAISKLPFVAVALPPLVDPLSVYQALLPLPVVALSNAYKGRLAEPVTLSSLHLSGVCVCRKCVGIRESTLCHPFHLLASLLLHVEEEQFSQGGELTSLLLSVSAPLATARSQ
mmetsp:Transcript_22683/g.50444  ORF Transcript_22683/g.50444 Transcript_22683/m.50444 type:complete len:200 (-) Transcript_22683:62-661(-)